jgi:hypothetical protein
MGGEDWGVGRLRFKATHFLGLAFGMEEDEAFNPVEIGFFGTEGIMFGA